MPSTRLRWTFFATTWAIAHLFHVLLKGGGELLWSGAHPELLAVLIAALALLVRPSSQGLLLVLAVVQLVVFAWQLPEVANHWTLAALGNAGLLATRSGTRAPHAGQRLTYLRALFLICYLAAAVAKLNEDFLFSPASCALTVAEAGLASLGAPTHLSWAVPSLPIVVVAIEFAVFALLLRPGSRQIGVALAAVFHVALAGPPAVQVADYTVFVLAFLILFLQDSWFQRALGELHMSARSGRMVIVLVTTLLLLTGAGREVFWGERFDEAVWATFVIYSAVFLTILWLIDRRREKIRVGSPGERLLHPALLVLLFVAIVNASSPYIGGKTMNSFTMFSNLRTEAGVSNHLLFPAAGWDGPQKELVRIEAADGDRLLEDLSRDDRLLPLHEVRRRVTHRDVQVTFARDERSGAESLSNVHDLAPAPFVTRKTWLFRPVAPPGQPQACTP